MWSWPPTILSITTTRQTEEFMRQPYTYHMGEERIIWWHLSTSIHCVDLSFPGLFLLRLCAVMKHISNVNKAHSCGLKGYMRGNRSINRIWCCQKNLKKKMNFLIGSHTNSFKLNHFSRYVDYYDISSFESYATYAFFVCWNDIQNTSTNILWYRNAGT